MQSDWNWKNKLLLMEAECFNTKREFDQAAACYEASIKAAREHKFIHEEALGSELAGVFFLTIGWHEKARRHLMHSVELYKKWGAFAVSKRIEAGLEQVFGLEHIRRMSDLDTLTEEDGEDDDDSDDLTSGAVTGKRHLHDE